MLTIYSADGAQKYPLDVPGATFYITHVYGGLDTLTFNISPNHELYPLISEEATVEYDDILYKIKNINERETACTVSCTIDLDETKANAYKAYHSETRTLRDVLQEQLPGWTLDGVDLVSSRRTIELEKCNGYDVVMQAAKTYNIAYEWHNKEKRVRILKPENVQPSGEYITDELNLRKLTFKGSSKSFATRIYPYGKNGLTIADVNGGLTYLENRTYSNQVISTVWADERYTDPISLRDDAIERLKGLAVPVRSYECDVVDLAKVHNDYSDLSMKLYDIVTLIDRRRGTRIDHRIVEYKEYPYNPEKNVVTLSSVAEKITTKIDKIEVKFNDEVKVDREKINEIRRDVDTNSARIAETYTKGETDTRIESLVQQSADSITTTVRQEISTAVDGIQVGGRNLLLKSDVHVTTTDYIMHDYYFGAEKPVAGETYTISIKGSLHKDKLYFGVFNSGGVIGVCYPTTPDADGVYRKTFPWIDKIDNAVAGNTFIRIYAMPSRITDAESTIEWIKLEKGNKASDWSPAPEDQEAALNQAVTTLNTQINQTAEKIQLEAEKTFTTKGELGMHTQELRSAIEANSDSIRSTVSRQDYDRDFETGGSKITSILNQTESSYQMYFSGKQQEILGAAREEAKAVADQKLEDYGTYFEFSQDGMLIGKKGTEGNFKARFDNEQLAFLEGDNVVTWISNRTFHALGMETEGAMNMTNPKVPGKWVTEADATGRLNIYWRE